MTSIPRGRRAGRTAAGARTGERGAALALVLVATGVMLAFSAAYLFAAGSGLRQGRAALEAQQAFDMAESGLEMALAEIKADPGWRGPIARTALGPGTFEVAIEALSGELRLISTGRVGSRQVRLEMRLSGGRFSLGSRALVSQGDLFLNEKTEIEGDVMVNGNVTVDGRKGTRVEIDGQLAMTGTLSWLRDPPIVSGGIVEGAPAVWATVDEAALRAAAGPNVLTGPVTLPKKYTMPGSVVFVEGDLTTRKNQEITGGGIIVATGVIRIDDHLKTDGSQPLLLIGLGGVVTKQGKDIEAALYSPTETYLAKQTKVFGGAYGAPVVAEKEVQIEYDPRLADFQVAGAPGAEWTITDWSDQS